MSKKPVYNQTNEEIIARVEWAIKNKNRLPKVGLKKKKKILRKE
jgi:hypothetical protein